MKAAVRQLQRQQARAEARAKAKLKSQQAERRVSIPEEQAAIFEQAEAQFRAARENISTVALVILAGHKVTLIQGARLERTKKGPVLIYLPAQAPPPAPPTPPTPPERK